MHREQRQDNLTCTRRLIPCPFEHPLLITGVLGGHGWHDGCADGALPGFEG